MVDLGNVIGPSGIISRNVSKTFTFNSQDGGIAQQKYIDIPVVSGYSAFDAIASVSDWKITAVPFTTSNNVIGINIISAYPYSADTPITITVTATIYYKKV